MLVNQHLMRLCRAIIDDAVDDENFGNMLFEAGVKPEEEEWAATNELLKKSEEISHAAGLNDKKTVH